MDIVSKDSSVGPCEGLIEANVMKSQGCVNGFIPYAFTGSVSNVSIVSCFDRDTCTCIQVGSNIIHPVTKCAAHREESYDVLVGSPSTLRTGLSAFSSQYNIRTSTARHGVRFPPTVLSTFHILHLHRSCQYFVSCTYNDLVSILHPLLQRCCQNCLLSSLAGPSMRMGCLFGWLPFQEYALHCQHFSFLCVFYVRVLIAKNLNSGSSSAPHPFIEIDAELYLFHCNNCFIEVKNTAIHIDAHTTRVVSSLQCVSSRTFAALCSSLNGVKERLAQSDPTAHRTNNTTAPLDVLEPDSPIDVAGAPQHVMVRLTYPQGQPERLFMILNCMRDILPEDTVLQCVASTGGTWGTMFQDQTLDVESQKVFR